MIRILYVMDHFRGTGGTERHVAHLVAQLPKDTFDCRIVVLDLAPNRWVDQIRAGGVPVTHVPVGREYLPPALMRARELAGLLRTHATDIVQTFHQKSDTYAASIARLAGVRHIVSSKRDTGELKKPHHWFMNRRLRGLFEKVIVVADSIGEVVVAREGVPRSKIVRIYNGVDALAFSPPSREQRREARARLGLKDGDFVVGMVARFRPEKSHDVFFAGALAAARSVPDLKILALGGGPLFEHFRGRYARELASGRIQMISDVSDVLGYLHAMDVGCLLPVRNEGFSNAVLEKMATGLPMVVSDVGGNAEAVVAGENGLVLPPGDASAFERALLALHSDPAARLRMAHRSRELVEEKFTLQHMCAEHARLYRSLVND